SVRGRDVGWLKWFIARGGFSLHFLSVRVICPATLALVARYRPELVPKRVPAFFVVERSRRINCRRRVPFRRPAWLKTGCRRSPNRSPRGRFRAARLGIAARTPRSRSRNRVRPAQAMGIEPDRRRPGCRYGRLL